MLKHKESHDHIAKGTTLNMNVKTASELQVVHLCVKNKD